MSILDSLIPKRTSETRRIIDLPVREPPELDAVEDLTPELARPGGTLTLRPIQSWALQEIRENRGGILAMGVGAGKAQPLDEPVLTPDGWRTMGDLRPGDFVVGSDGLPTEVLGVFPQGVVDIYEVTTEDGRRVRACGDHLWSVRRDASRPFLVKNTKQLRPGNQLPLPSAPCVESDTTLPVDPWLLGSLLGDGCPAYFSNDTEDLWGPEAVIRLLDSLHDLGGMDHKAVPEQYLDAPAADRYALLQGLMDTDGSVTRAGGCEYNTSSEQLARDVERLVRSLGGVARFTSGARSWRGRIQLPADKQAAAPTLTAKVASVEPAGRAEAVCIQVAAEDSLYVTTDYVVTHNTLVSYCAPVVLDVDPEDVLVLVPANLRSTFRREGLKYAKHFATPTDLPVLSYAELSRPESTDYLTRTRPKVIICDEAHYLRSSDATRTRRFGRYLDSAPDTILVAMSGTLFSSSIKDAQALMRHALGDGAPVPGPWATLEFWAACIDVPKGMEAAPTARDYSRLKALVEEFGPGGLMGMTWAERKVAVRKAYHRRFVSTPGVVHTRESSASNSIVIQPIEPGGGPYVDVAGLIEEVEATWTRPDGKELEDELRVNEALRSLSLGYYMTWEWGEDGPDEEWNDARLGYAREVSRFLRRDRPGIDSPYLVEQAARRTLGLPTDTDGPTLDRPDLLAAYCLWDPIRDRACPEPRGVVVTTDLLAQVVKYARAEVKSRSSRGIIWYSHRVCAEMLEALGVRVYHPGSDPEADPNPRGTVCGMSIASHGTGKNLQAWSSNFVLYPPAGGKVWEQLIGRTHRPGQTDDTVTVAIVAHTPEHKRAIRKAKEDATFAQTVQGQKQKILLASWLDPISII